MEPAAHYASCSACGTSPIDHRFAFLVNVIDEVVMKASAVLFSWLPDPYESPLVHTLFNTVYGLLARIGLARFETSPDFGDNTRSKLIWDEAVRRGIPIEQIVLFGKALDQYRAYLAGRWVHFESLPIPHWLPQSGYAWVDDKFALAEALAEAGIPAPKANKITSFAEALMAFKKIGAPVIIKPRIGSRGRHTTTNISTEAELAEAYQLAREIARELVIEEHLFGSVYRATVVQGNLVGFFRADPPCVKGDGNHSISELVEVKNAERSERIGAIRITDDTHSFLKRQGYTLESVPASGKVVNLSAKTGRFFGGYTREMLGEVHTKLFEIFKRASEVVEAPVVGFDVIIPDPSSDPDAQTWGIIECNSLPFIDLHYFALEGKPNNIAPHIWDLWLLPR